MIKTIKITNKFIVFLDRALVWFMTIFLVFIMFLGLYALYDYNRVFESAAISEDILSLRPEDGVKSYSLKGLQEINEDINGWIIIDDTEIDYPIVQGEDNSEYINADYKGEYATAGSIFLDYRNEKDFSDDYSIIYGHNMKDKLMFAAIKNYENEEFFKTHEKGTLYAESGIYDINIYAYVIVNGFTGNVYNLTTYRNNNNSSVVDYFNKNNVYRRDLEIKPTDKLLLLSTCDSYGANNRAVLLARLRLRSDNTDEEIEVKEELFEEKPKEETRERRKTTIGNGFSLYDSSIGVLAIIVLIIFIVLALVYFRMKVNENKRKRDAKK